MTIKKRRNYIERQFQSGYAVCEAQTGSDHAGCEDQTEASACKAAVSEVDGKECLWRPRREKIKAGTNRAHRLHIDRAHG